MNHIAILLATYNGAKFLREQLDSLIVQSCQDWVLYVRDDGSKDETVSILRNYQSRFPQKIVLIDNENQNLGAKNSFAELLRTVEHKYYMFCDQDDVWFKDKIKITFHKMKHTEESNSGKAVLVFSDAVVTDQNLNETYPSFWKSTKITPAILNRGRMFEVFNCAPGCTMMINNKLKPLLFPFPNKAPMHDWWIAIVAQRSGVIDFIDQPLMHYRQHGSNTIGAQEITKDYFIQKFYRFSNTIKAQKNHLEFLKEIQGQNALQFYWSKMKLNIQRFVSN